MSDVKISKSISLSLERFESLLGNAGLEIVNVFNVGYGDDASGFRFFELKSSKYRIVFFVHVPERFAFKANSDDDEKVINVYVLDVTPRYKTIYIDLLRDVLREGSSESHSSIVIACKEYLCYVGTASDENSVVSYSFNDDVTDDDHIVANPLSHPKSETIRDLEKDIGVIYSSVVKIPKDDVTFIENVPETKESPEFELYDDDGTEITTIVGGLLDFSPKIIHLSSHRKGDDEKTVEYVPLKPHITSSPLNEFLEGEADDTSVGNTSVGNTSVGNTSVGNTSADHHDTSVDRYTAIVRRAESKHVRNATVAPDIGEVYVCYNIDELFALIKDGEDFEERLLADYEMLYDVEVSMRDRRLDEIDRSLNEFKTKTLRSLESVRESEDEIKTQIRRLMKILSSCKTVSTKVKAGSTKESENLTQVEERSQTMLNELTIELASKRDTINSILANYHQRIMRIFE